MEIKLMNSILDQAQIEYKNRLYHSAAQSFSNIILKGDRNYKPKKLKLARKGLYLCGEKMFRLGLIDSSKTVFHMLIKCCPNTRESAKALRAIMKIQALNN